LIRTLEQENTRRNKQFATVLLALPLLSILPYIPDLFNGRTTLLSILSITSLLSTAYLLYVLPPGQTAISYLDALNSPPSKDKLARRQLSQNLGLDKGPIKQYLPYLNLGLGGVLVLLGMVVSRKIELWWGFGWLPAGVYAVVLLAKWMMGSVDPEGELGGLRYGFKGA
jgi:ABC-type dipeptide/oligopeptide/nickel transport system permease component